MCIYIYTRTDVCYYMYIDTKLIHILYVGAMMRFSYCEFFVFQSLMDVLPSGKPT